MKMNYGRETEEKERKHHNSQFVSRQKQRAGLIQIITKKILFARVSTS